MTLLYLQSPVFSIALANTCKKWRRYLTLGTMKDMLQEGKYLIPSKSN